MKYCEKCKLSVRGNLKRCPLCQAQLSGEGEEPLFPDIPPTIYKQYKLFFKLLILASVVAVVVCMSIDLILSDTISWSFFVLFGIICFWISLFIATKQRHAIPQNITRQVFVVSVFSVLWDYFTTWKGWSVNYAIPIICTIAMISLLTLAKIIKMKEEDCIFSLVVTVCFGLIPLVLLLIGKIYVRIPTLICVAVSIIVTAILILFEGKVLIQELKRKFHV